MSSFYPFHVSLHPPLQQHCHELWKKPNQQQQHGSDCPSARKRAHNKSLGTMVIHLQIEKTFRRKDVCSLNWSSGSVFIFGIPDNLNSSCGSLCLLHPPFNVNNPVLVHNTKEISSSIPSTNHSETLVPWNIDTRNMSHNHPNRGKNQWH